LFVDTDGLRRLLADVSAGVVSADDAVAALRHLPFADLGFATVDHHRHVRQGMAEAIYGPGKTPDQAARIAAELLARSETAPVVLTRADPDQIAAATEANPGAQVTGTTVVWRPAPPRSERVVLVTAGTADLPVADECAATLTAHGLAPRRLTDVGVAGVHRLLGHAETLLEADAVVVVAGMEGALASVVGGLTGAPMIAVPTSVGYGAGLEGVTALLAMLSSCAAGICVVGIDNGYGAACAVARLFLTPDRRALPTGSGPRPA
jgi:NCAIR mutase (PurE)-related protein